MNTNMDGRHIRAVYWPDTESEQGRRLVSDNDRQLTLSAQYHGDRDEFWIIESERIQGEWVEVSRYNPRYVEAIQWAEL